MTVHSLLKTHGVEALVLAEVQKEGKRLVLALERAVGRVNLIDHERSDDAEDVRALDAESLLPKISDWLKKQGVPEAEHAAILAAAKAKLLIPA
jgi:hypothetical protein